MKKSKLWQLSEKAKPGKRSQWLKHNKDALKLESAGKKRFEVQKNISSPNFPTVIDYEIKRKQSIISLPKIETPRKSIQNPTPEKQTSRIKELELRLKEKQSEIDTLRDMYMLASSHLQEKLESTPSHKITQRSHSIISSGIQNKSHSDLKQADLFSNKRNASIQVYKPPSFLELANHPAFKHPRYPKSHPKLVLTNPITGIPPYF
jgi:hypothetical protein